MLLYTLKLLLDTMGNKKKETVNETDSTDSLPKKVVWTPPDIKFKSRKGKGRKSNVKCIYCGKEYYKKHAKSNLKVCDECIEINEFRAPPSFPNISCGANEPSIGYNPDEKNKETYNEVNRIILALLPETPELNQEENSIIAKKMRIPTKKMERIPTSGILDPPCVGCNNFKEHYILSEPSSQKPERIQEQDIQQTIDCLHKMDFCDKMDFCGELCRKLGCYKCMDYLLERYDSKELKDFIFDHA